MVPNGQSLSHPDRNARRQFVGGHALAQRALHTTFVGGNKKQALRVDGMKLVMAKVIYYIYKQYYTFFIAQVVNF